MVIPCLFQAVKSIRTGVRRVSLEKQSRNACTKNAGAQQKYTQRKSVGSQWKYTHKKCWSIVRSTQVMHTEKCWIIVEMHAGSAGEMQQKCNRNAIEMHAKSAANQQECTHPVLEYRRNAHGEKCWSTIKMHEMHASSAGIQSRTIQKASRSDGNARNQCWNTVEK